MTAPKRAKRSAYPRTVAELVEDARQLARDLGEIPSQGIIMRELHCGQPKARQVLDALARTRLHALPAPDEAPPEWPPVPALGHIVADSGATIGAAPAPAPARPVSAPAPDLPAPAEPPAPATPSVPEADPEPAPVATPPAQATPVSEPVNKRFRAWPVAIIGLSAFVAVWSGWVGLGRMTGYGLVNLLPGIVGDGKWSTIDTSILLPLGVECYGAFALSVWLSGRGSSTAKTFAKRSAFASLATGALGQIAYHMMAAAGWGHAPWWITALVSCLPVAVLGMAAALLHLVRNGGDK